MRCIFLVVAAMAAAGCSPTGPAEAEPGRAPGMPGPLLVSEIVNRTDRELVFSYEFEASDRSTAGSGEGLVSPCTAMTERWSEITGAYSILVDGEVIHEGRLAPGQGDGAYLVARLQIQPDGDIDMLPPVVVAAAPPIGSRQLAQC